MSDKTWKRAERRVSKWLSSAFGGECKRVPVTGRQRGATPDIDGDKYGLSVECKYRQTIPEWLTEAMTQAKAYGDSRGLEPVVVVIPAGKAIGDALVIRRLRDFAEVK